MLSLYRGVKDGENIGIIVENKHLKGLAINLVCVIITFNHRFFCVQHFVAALSQY